MIVDSGICKVRLSRERVVFELADGRIVDCPMDWFPLLAAAHPDAREQYEITDEGAACHWPALGERVSVDCVLLNRLPGDGRGVVPMPGNGAWGGLAERAVPFSLPEKSGEGAR